MLASKAARVIASREIPPGVVDWPLRHGAATLLQKSAADAAATKTTTTTSRGSREIVASCLKTREPAVQSVGALIKTTATCHTKAGR